jgi:3-phosphoshikimate 1-carboxyvinyltransferase
MKVTKARRIKGRVRLPGDKSISHRAAIIAALAEGGSQISNFSTAQDCSSTLSCLRQLGVSIEQKDQKLFFKGSQKLTPPTKPLDCGNSGSTMRILAGVLAGTDFPAVLVGDESLSSRPMRRIIEPLQLMGAMIESTDGNAPVTVHGSHRLVPIKYKLPVASAQVKSAILFAGLNAEGRTEVIETSVSRDHTERLFNGFGVTVATNSEPSVPHRSVTLDGPARLSGGPITIPGDISSAAYFIAAAMLLAGSELTIQGVGLNPTRAEFLSVLKSWGADIETADLKAERNEPIGTVHVRGGIEKMAGASARKLGGSTIPVLIDELPLLAVVGSQISGGIEIRDAGELRLKESDRLAATSSNLRLMGAEVEEYPDGLAVFGPTKLQGARVDSYRDHRIAMAFAVAGLIANGDTEIMGSECADISFPEFFGLLHAIAER